MRAAIAVVIAALLSPALAGQTSGCSPFTICQPAGGGGGGPYSGIGACAAGEFVIELADGAAPVCSTAGPYAGSATDGGPATSATGLLSTGTLKSGGSSLVIDDSGDIHLMRLLCSGTWGGGATDVCYVQPGKSTAALVYGGFSGSSVPMKNFQAEKILLGPTNSQPDYANFAVVQVDNLGGTTTVPVLRSRGAVSQTGDLIQAQSSGGTTLWRVGADGHVTWPGESHLNADGTNATATMANTGISAPVTSGRKYSFTLWLSLAESVAGEGAKIDFDGGTATATNFRAHCEAKDTTFLAALPLAALATDFPVATITGDSEIYCKGSFEPATGGTFAPRYAQNTHVTGTLTLYRGSHLVMFEQP